MATVILTIPMTPDALMGELHCADCCELVGQLPERSVHLTIFSPNYGTIRDGWNATLDNLVDLGGLLRFATVDSGIACVVMQDQRRDHAQTGDTFRLAAEWLWMGWRLFTVLVYQRDGRDGPWYRDCPRPDHEYVLVFVNNDSGPPRVFRKDRSAPSKHAGRFFSGTVRLTSGKMKRIERKRVNPTKCSGTVWKIAPSNTERNRLKMQHPSTFPDRLAGRLIEMFSDPGDLVLDPMMGSGTVPYVARKMGRSYIGGDLNWEYTELARERLSGV
jgi:site-specific DNA-methyltransferase (adenine-specific)